MKAKLLRHIIFWIVNIALITVILGAQLQGHYLIALPAVLMVLPIHAFYFYGLSYYIIPRYFFQQQFVKLFIACLACTVLATLSFRAVDILFVDPFFLSLSDDPANHFDWHMPRGAFIEKLFQPAYIAGAFIGSNSVVWIGVSIKFIKMWYDKREAATLAELNFLKSQIHPHFLFNTLNNLYALSLVQSPQTPGVILGLSKILRYMLYECNTDQVSLRKDVEILNSYIALEKIRYEERLELNVNISIDSGMQQIAPLLLLPLVENAFKHGVSETEQCPWINIELKAKGDKLTFNVSNSKPETVPSKPELHYSKIGLANVRKRLELLYRGRHILEIYDEDDCFISVLNIELTV
jgi:hypothetical protein